MSPGKDLFDRDHRPLMQKETGSENIKDQFYTAGDIDTHPAKVESIESYREQVNNYQALGYSYIPIPSSIEYYDVEEGWIRDMRSTQVIDEEFHLMEVLQHLQNELFLLIDYMEERRVILFEPLDDPLVLVNDESLSSDNELIMSYNEVKEMPYSEVEGNIYTTSLVDAKEEYPNLSNILEEVTVLPGGGAYDSEERYGIITLADINRRGVKMMIYFSLSSLVSKLSYKIEEEYSDSESILKYINPTAIGRWFKDRIGGQELHIVEYMNLKDIIQVIQASNSSFKSNCGFGGSNDVSDLNSINDIRNRVMHANRSLVYTRRDIDDIISVIDKSGAILSEMD